jgi:hypothetical protein
MALKMYNKIFKSGTTTRNQRKSEGEAGCPENFSPKNIDSTTSSGSAFSLGGTIDRFVGWKFKSEGGNFSLASTPKNDELIN